MMRLLLLLVAALLVACSTPEPPLVASDVEITKPMPGRHMSAGYFVLTNKTDSDIRITDVSSPHFVTVEIHESVVVDGINRMRELKTLVVPARGSVTLQRGGKHLMLMRAKDIGDSVSLEFSSNGAPVLTIDYTFPADTG